MKIALIADTHFGVRNDSPVFHEYFRRSLKDFFAYIDEHDIKHVIHLGDLFDRRKYLNFLTAKICRETFLDELEKRNLETHIICGNHDVFYKDTNVVNALTEIVDGRYKTIKTYIDTVTVNVAGIDICLVPWINDTNFRQSHEEIKNTKAELCIGHLELSGFEMFRGAVADHGEDKNEYKKFDLVFTGHFHHRSSVDNIHYIGAFGEYTWTDYNDARGFTIFDTQTREFEFIKNKNIMFRMMTYDDVKVPDMVEKIQASNFSKYANTYVKVVCVNRNNPYAFDLFFDKLYKAGPIDISVIEDASSIIDMDDENVDQTEDTITILSKYIKGLTLPVNNDKMIHYMKDIYTEALSVEHVE